MNKEQKTPEQWFQMLKEPYRSEAIVNLVDDRPVLSLNSALECQKAWNLTPQGLDYWYNIAVSIQAGETTYLEPETLTPEPIELRPEDLVSGDVYTAKIGDDRYTFKFDKLIDRKSNPLVYSSMYNHQLKINVYGNCMPITDIKFYHATHIEKALLLGEEELIDWEKKYNELKAKYDQLQQIEKVYFYMNTIGQLMCTSDKEHAILSSEEDEQIYEAIKLGVKKSVLVNE